MDFHSLTRRELQSLCKLNKIPANITNIAMADALQSLEIVVGIEDFLNVSQSETADLVKSVEKIEASSPKAPQTRCRTTTRQKVKTTETENLPPTATRTTRRGRKQLAGEVEESKNNMMKTPAISSTRRKAPATSSCRNVTNQLNECENEAKEESNLQNKYSTRRSSRLTEKKSAETRVKKESEKAVDINSFLDEVNVTSKEHVEVLENTVESGNPNNAQVENICNAFKKLDVLVVEEEKEDCGEVDNLKQESDETSNQCEDNLKISDAKNDDEYDMKLESDGISSPCEDDNLEQKLDLVEEKFINSEVKEKNLVMVLEENSDSLLDNNSSLESDGISSPCEDDNLEQKLDLVEEKFNNSEVKEKNLVMVLEENSDSLLDNNSSLESGADDINAEASFINTEDLNGPPELGHEDMFSADSAMNNQVPESNGSSTMASDMIIDEITTKEMEEMYENTVDESFDVIPTVDNHSTMTEEVQDLNPELFTEINVNEKADADEEKDQFGFFSGPCFPAQNPLILSREKATPFKNMSIVSDDKENIDSGRKLQIVFVDEGKKSKKEKDEIEKLRNLNEISIRQLRKQVKALTLKNLNSNENPNKEAATTRPALQALCENQLVGGEKDN